MIYIYETVESGTEDHGESVGTGAGCQKNKVAPAPKVQVGHSSDDRKESAVGENLPRSFGEWLSDPKAKWISEIPRQLEFNFGATAAADTSAPAVTSD